MSINRRELLSWTCLTATGVALGGPKSFARAHLDQLTGSEVSPGSRKSIQPGEVWLDTSGKPIQAHGGSIIHVDNLFYWYGENKEGFVPGGQEWQHGIRFYSSPDFYNWTDLGALIPSVLDDPSSPLAPASRAERPHIIFNAATGKYVCWIKVIDKKFQTRIVLTADRITGPYTLVRKGLRPMGMSAGDFDLCVNQSDGKAYHYFDRTHFEVICADLSDDYTDQTGYYSTHFPRPRPPYAREGPAYFFRKGKHYLATSGVSGYHPNPSEIATAETFHGPWTLLGDLHPTDASRTSFNSQISCVFKHPQKKDLYIAVADRWIPDLPATEGADFSSGDAYRQIESALKKATGGDAGKLTEVEAKRLQQIGSIGTLNTSASTYVWLPIHFDGERPAIDWRDEWSLEEFA